MKIINVDELYSIRSSRGVVENYPLSNQNEWLEPKYDQKVLRLLAKYDPIIDTALQLTVDLTTLNSYELIGNNKREKDRLRKLLDDTLNYDEEMDNVLYQTILLGDGYMEIVRDDFGNPLELHALETTQMKIKYDAHGEVEYYVQVPTDSSAKEVRWNPEDIVHYTFRKVGSTVYGESMFISIPEVFASRRYSLYYLRKLMKNNPPRIMHFLRGADKKAKEEFLEDLRYARQRGYSDVVAYGMNNQADYKAFESQGRFDPSFVSFLTELRKEALSVTRVPPHWVGMLDGANRGIGENVTIPFDARIKKLQSKVNSQNNRELLPKLGISSTQFRYKPPTISDEKAISEVAVKLSTVGLDGDSIIEFMRSKGFALRDGATIENPEKPPEEVDDSGQITVDLNRDGTSDAGREKIDKRKMKVKA